MDQELITLTQRIVKDTMEKLAEKQATFNTYKRRPRIPSTNSEKTVTRFIGRRLRFEDDTFVFEGETVMTPSFGQSTLNIKRLSIIASIKTLFTNIQ